MWVRSQDKGYLVKNPIIDIDIRKNEVYILDRTYAKNSFVGRILGVYKSKERAVEVLDEIQERISPKFNYEGNNEEVDIFIKTQMLNSMIAVYQMPEE